MLRTKRIHLIQEYVMEKGTVSIDDLVSKFNVSKNTIRRDIHLLVESGKLKKVYGGVEVNPENTTSNSEQLADDLLMDDEIAKSAADFVEEGDIIFIDAEFQTTQMVKYLQSKHITVITNSLDFISRAIKYENLNVISLGGILNRKVRSFTTLNINEQLNGLNINRAFFAPVGISLKKGITHSSPLENELKQAIINKSTEVFLLADYYKFDKAALMTYCSLDDVDYIITDYPPEEKYIEYTKESELHLVIARE